mmetsp:Transcript_8942/g.15012  ORF Transcript_8942/g.15012 Transcript_8942/m.15012 type:complete len:221 (-) Transcript_8942:71-733(-)
MSTDDAITVVLCWCWCSSIATVAWRGNHGLHNRAQVVFHQTGIDVAKTVQHMCMTDQLGSSKSASAAFGQLGPSRCCRCSHYRCHINDVSPPNIIQRRRLQVRSRKEYPDTESPKSCFGIFTVVVGIRLNVASILRIVVPVVSVWVRHCTSLASLQTGEIKESHRISLPVKRTPCWFGPSLLECKIAARFDSVSLISTWLFCSGEIALVRNLCQPTDHKA